jgi:RNA polymerase sigma factor for flagellar operon FliA
MSSKLSRENIDKLWKDYKRTSSPDLRNRLVEQYLPLVRYIAERVACKLPKSVDVDDLTSAGIFGLFDAIDGFDMGRNVKFQTYCATRIRGAILDELRSMDWVPRLIRSRAHKLENATRELEAQLGRYPTDKEIADHLGISVAEYEEMVREASAAVMLSLNKSWSDDDDDRESGRSDLMEDERAPDPLQSLQREELKRKIIDSLDETQRLVVVLYYYEELTMKEIGAVLDLSESRVCQIHSKIVNRLHGQLKHLRNQLL